ncbi:hypothetical protein HY992_06090 [Candidatus Micrarchaeota archaeon]|nr:hypothetical protein [Candidatus Micrarchaeota archaeon]
MKQFNAEYIGEELEQIGIRIRQPIDIFLIGGCAMSFRKFKETTKDVDIVFRNKSDCDIFCDALFGAQYYEPLKIIDEYTRLEPLKMFENKDGFHLDLFVKKVCGKLELSKEIVKRAEFYKKYGNAAVYLVAKEDVFLFKSLASESRKRDLDDMRTIYQNLDWQAILKEIKSQKLSSQLTGLMISRMDEFKKTFDLDVPILNTLKKMNSA